MGVTISSKNHSIDMGYFGFNSLRTKVAELTAPDICEHYKGLTLAPMLGEARKSYFDAYNKKTNELNEKYDGKYLYVLHFLYASDCGAEMPPDVCEKIYEVIKDYDDDILYGYSGRPDCAKFKDFKEIVKNCIDNNCSMEWY